MIYYSVYIILLFLWILAVDKGRNRKIFFLFSAFLLLALLSGFRYENKPCDFMTNYRHILRISNLSWGQVFGYNSNFLHNYFRKLIAVVFGDPQWYFIITAAFVVGSSLYCAKKYVDNVYLYTILFYIAFGFFPSNNITRQSIAVAFTIIAWDSLINRKLIKFSIIMLISCLFHTSTVFFIPLYIMSYFPVSKKNFIVYICGSILIIVFSRPIIQFLQLFIYSDYRDDSYGMVASNLLRLVLPAIIGMALLLCIKRGLKNFYLYPSENRDGNINLDFNCEERFTNFIFHGAILYVICTVLSSLRILMFSRIAMFYAPCALVCIDRALNAFEKKSKKIVVFGLVLFATCWLIAMNEAGKLIPTPYTPFWMFPERIVIR